MKEIKEHMERTKSLLTKNVNMPHNEVDGFMMGLIKSNKPSQIAASFDTVMDLKKEHLDHFKTAPYVWKPLSGGTIWGGFLLDDTLNYVHLVLASENVVEYIMKL